jgi:hypothetical protein
MAVGGEWAMLAAWNRSDRYDQFHPFAIRFSGLSARDT